MTVFTALLRQDKSLVDNEFKVIFFLDDNDDKSNGGVENNYNSKDYDNRVITWLQQVDRPAGGKMKTSLPKRDRAKPRNLVSEIRPLLHQGGTPSENKHSEILDPFANRICVRRRDPICP